MRRIYLLLATLVATVISAKAADTDLNIVKTEYSKPGVAESFRTGSHWLPLPDYKDRAGWSKLFGPQRAAVIRRGEKYLNYQWQVIPATAYLEFERTGNRVVMEDIYFANTKAIMSLFLAELAEGKGRFTDQLVNGVWQSTQMTSWALSAHQYFQHSKRPLPDEREHLIDIFGGRYGEMMSFIYYFFHNEFDKIDPSISLAMESAIKRNILDPYLDTNEHFVQFWMGYDPKKMLNNWTPWCTAETMTCFFLMEKDPARLQAAIDQSIMSVDKFLNYVKKDGACEEGPSYWAVAYGKLYDYLQLMYDVSDGKFNLFDNPRICKMSEFTSRANIAEDWQVNFADGPARQKAAYQVVWCFGKATGSQEAMNYALASLADNKKGKFDYPEVTTEDAFVAIRDLVSFPEIDAQIDSLNNLVSVSSLSKVTASLRKDVPAATWYPETEFCFMRNASGWFLGAKGGFNNESHNHNDVGSFVLFIGNTPVLIDAGKGTYTKQTFVSKERYKIWQNQSQWHNVPVINGGGQLYGAEYKSSNAVCDTKKGVFSLEMQNAYSDTSKCTYLKRTYKFPSKGKPSLTITDDYKISSRQAPDVEHFLVNGEVDIHDGYLVIHCANGINVRLEYPKSLTATCETKELTDPIFTGVWGSDIKRISLTSKSDAPLKGTYTFFISRL
jgi:hypothetical protein